MQPNDDDLVDVSAPMLWYVLAGRVGPTPEQAALFARTEWLGGPLDGLALQMPNMVDWAQSDVDVSPLIPWLGHPDARYPRILAEKLERRWHELAGQLEVIKIEVDVIGYGYKWGDLIRCGPTGSVFNGRDYQQRTKEGGSKNE
jgi:hypothetical protein